MESNLYIHNHAGMAPGAHRLPPHFLKNIKIIGFLLKKSTQSRKNESFARKIKNLPMYRILKKKSTDTQLHQIYKCTGKIFLDFFKPLLL